MVVAPSSPFRPRVALALALCALLAGCSSADAGERPPPSTGGEGRAATGGLALPPQLPLHRALPPESPGVLHLRVDALLASPLGHAAAEVYERAAERDPAGGSGIFPILRATEEMVMTILPSRRGRGTEALFLCRGRYDPATIARFLRLGEIQLSEPRSGLLRGMAGELAGELFREVEIAIHERRHFMMGQPDRVDSVLRRLRRGEGAGPSLEGFDDLSQRVALGEAEVSAVVMLTAQALSIFDDDPGSGVHLRGAGLRVDVEEGLRVTVFLDPEPDSVDVVRQSVEGAIDGARGIAGIDRLGLGPLFRSLELAPEGRLLRIEARMTAAELDRALLEIVAAAAPAEESAAPPASAAPPGP